nr:uncharacterized protein LOC127339590 [Lolium perenne]
MYNGKNDESRVNSANLSDEDLHDEVRHLTCFSMKDTIVLTSARSPYDVKHLPAEASTVAQCYPPTPESGVEPEDDDEDSDETEDAQHILEDSDVQEDEVPDDDALTRSRRCKRINEDLITTAESSPSGQDKDADETASPPPATKISTSLFAMEDDLDLSDDDDDVRLAKRTKLSFEKTVSAKEPNPSPAKSASPSRTTVEKIPVSKGIPSGNAPTPSAARDHPIYAKVDAVAEFAEQFTRSESENSHLWKTIKTSADQVLEANRLATDAQKENTLLKEELKKLKQKMKDDQDARSKAAIAVDEKEGVLRESIANLMVTAPDEDEENKRIHEKIEAMADVAHPNHELWSNRPKAVVVAKFEHRAEKVHYYFNKFHAQTLFPLDEAPETLSALFTRFKSPERIQLLVRKELLGGAERALASVLACHPTLDLEAIANTNRSLDQYYDIARNPAYTIISRMEAGIERDLRAREDHRGLS